MHNMQLKPTLHKKIKFNNWQGNIDENLEPVDTALAIKYKTKNVCTNMYMYIYKITGYWYRYTGFGPEQIPMRIF